MLNYTYSDSYAILNYVNDRIVQFTKEEQKALRYKFNYWKKKNNQKAAIKEYKQREITKSSVENSRVSTSTTKSSGSLRRNTTQTKTPKIEKPEDHGTIKRLSPVYHPDYGKGFTQEYISENGKPKIEIIFGDGGPGTGSGLYSLAQLNAKHSKWYFGSEAIEKAEAYYEAQKTAKSNIKSKLLQASEKKALGKTDNQEESALSLKPGQVILSKSSGKGIISKIYKENNEDMVNIKYPVMTLSYKMSEIKDTERFTVTDEIKDISGNKAKTVLPSTTSKEPKHETEIVKQTASKQETTVHEQAAASHDIVVEAVKEPRKDYHRKLNSQEAAIADTVVRYVRNIPSEKQNEYGSSIQSTSEQFAKANNIPTPPPIQTAAIKARKKSRLVNITPNKESEQGTEQERSREIKR